MDGWLPYCLPQQGLNTILEYHFSPITYSISYKSNLIYQLRGHSSYSMLTQILSRIECISYSSSTFHSRTWWIIRRWECWLSWDCREVVRLISSPSSRFIEYTWDWLADVLLPVGVKYEFWPLLFVMPCPHPVLNEITNGFRHGTVDTIMLQWRRMAVTIIVSDWCRGASGRKSERLR